MPRFHRLADFFGVWSMEPQAFSGQLEVVNKIDLQGHIVAYRQDDEKPKVVSSLEKVPSRGGQSIAVVRVLGTLMKGQSSMGGTSTVQLRRDIRQAAADQEVSAIMLVIDSPGGTVAGTFDLAAEVKSARKSKPIYAQIDDLGASAAFWVASQADKVYASNPTTLVGSIGTLMVVYDASGAAEKEGVRALVFATGPIKGAGSPGAPVTDEQRAYFQQLIDETQKSFDGAVQKGRGLTDRQLADVRSGAVFVAATALDRKLIDGIQPLARSMDELIRASSQSSSVAAVVPGSTSGETAAAQGLPLAAALPAPLAGERPGGSDVLVDDVIIPTQSTQPIQPSKALGLITKGIQMNFNDWLKAKGFDPETISEAQRETLEAAWRSDAKSAPESTFNSTMQTIEDEGLRCKQVRDATAEAARLYSQEPERVRQLRELCESAITNKTQINDYRLALIRFDRALPTQFSTHINERRITDDVLEAGLCVAGGLPDLDKHFSAQTLEVANKRWKGGLTIGELVLMAAHQGGFRGMNLRDTKSVLRAAFRSDNEMMASVPGPSTYSLPIILSNTANRFLKVGFDSVDQAWRMIAAIGSSSDFKQFQNVQLTGGLLYNDVAPGGELKHGTISELGYTNQIGTTGLLLAIDRKDLINDNLGALTGAGRRMGRGGALTLNAKFWTAFLNNSSFFTAGNNNVITGGSSALSLGALDLANQKFLNQTDPDGNPLGSTPKKLVVPTALWATARALLQSTTIVSTTTANTPLPDQNIFAGAFELVSSPYMSNSSYTGYSAAAWYLLADPADLPVIQVAFLNGMESPTVETADADFSTLGIAMRAYFDVGVSLQEYRGGIRAAGS